MLGGPDEYIKACSETRPDLAHWGRQNVGGGLHGAVAAGLTDRALWLGCDNSRTFSTTTNAQGVVRFATITRHVR